MYLGWSVRVSGSREYRIDLEGWFFAEENNAAICSAIDLEILIFEGKKLIVEPADVGADSEQFSPQHRRAILASSDLSPLFALSQHSIIFSFGECKGVPDTTPPATAKSTKRIKTRASITYTIQQLF